MSDLSERQSLLLRRMGVDVWKLRGITQNAANPVSSDLPGAASQGAVAGRVADASPVTLPAGSQPPTVQIESDEAGVEPPVSIRKDTPIAKQSEVSAADPASVEPVVQPPDAAASPQRMPEQSEPSAGETDPGADQSKIISKKNNGPIVNWRTVVEHQPDTDWLFVCALETDFAAAGKKLFDAILFALKLDATACSRIWASAVREGEEQHVDNSVDDSNEYIAGTLQAQLGKEQPDNIMLFGEQLAQFVIGTDKPIDQLRTEDYRYQGGSSRLIVTYDLKHILENPLDKAKVWRDLQKAQS